MPAPGEGKEVMTRARARPFAQRSVHGIQRGCFVALLRLSAQLLAVPLARAATAEGCDRWACFLKGARARACRALLSS